MLRFGSRSETGKGNVFRTGIRRESCELKAENEAEEVSDDVDDYWVMHVR